MNDLLFTPDTKLIRLFLDWLKGFDEQHATNWGFLYYDNPEAAMSEATFWGILRDCGVDVEPNADLLTSRKAPDFRCRKDGFEFFFEVTCIGIEIAIEQTGLPHPTEPGARNYSLLNRAIWNACSKKNTTMLISRRAVRCWGRHFSLCGIRCVYLRNRLNGF